MFLKYILMWLFVVFGSAPNMAFSNEGEHGGDTRPTLARGLALRGYDGIKEMAGDTNEQRYKSLKTFTDVLHIIERNYVREVPAEQLIQGAVKGMMKELDPHSHFLSAEEFTDLDKATGGQFSGLGLELEIKNGQAVVISVLEDSPAFRAGIKPGHIVLQVNNKKTDGLNFREIAKMFKSKRNTKFRILIKEPGAKTPRLVQLKSELVSFKSVLHKDLGAGLLYLRISAFTNNTAREVRKILERTGPPAGMILDLRGNPGGVFSSAVRTADLFIDKGVLVRVKGRLKGYVKEQLKEYKEVFYAQAGDSFLNFPILVLIDAYSASAAELLAGALKENSRAVLLGRKSFGKGSVLSLIPLEQGGAIQLTVAHYYTPQGHSIHGHGIEPDMKLKKPEPTNKSKAIHFRSKEDTDFQQAVSFLKIFNYFGSSASLSSAP